MKLALATANPGKIREIREILSGFDVELVSRDDLGILFEVEETGSTFFENALIKAKAIMEASGLPAIADDSGLVVDALDGEPGVYSSSYGGEIPEGGRRYLYLLEKMENVELRSAKFVCTIVCAFPDGSILSEVGECHGKITPAPRGAGGFGYDPVFLVDGTNKTMAELSQKEKNEISHRGVALRKLARRLGEEW